MITGLGISTIWTLDQDSAKEFFVEKLGLELRTDMRMGEDGPRWVTVGAKDQPDVQLALMVPGPPTMDPESTEQMRSLLAKGVLGAGAFTADDCEATYRELRAKGVEFVSEPQRRPYGIEAIFRDDSGNWYSLTQPFQQLDQSADWSC